MKYYLGVDKSFARVVFRSAVTPTEGNSPYRYAIGPFRTKRGALYMASHPNCQAVSDAEKAARDACLKPKYKTVATFRDENMPRMNYTSMTEKEAIWYAQQACRQFAGLKMVHVERPDDYKIVFAPSGDYLFTVPPMGK